ncbi:MAG: ATP-binding protein [Sedimentisphaerales bacterium]|nr:ATP-binding protein [Sedimentisphaerales bacterium]
MTDAPKEIVVISGKGGTGKTSLVGSFAALAREAVLADCDVDAADLHLLLAPDVKETHDFVGGKIASIVSAKCIGCGRCKELCHFDALALDGPANDVVQKTYAVDPIACEGCGVCVKFCPVEAIDFNDAINGQWFLSETRFGPMVHAKLGAAEENSGKLVSLIRKQAKQVAQQRGLPLILVDGSPGIGCSVIASISGADLVLVVTEPTLSGQHDLERVTDLAAHFGTPAMVCVNKWDINPEIAGRIEENARQRGLQTAGRIPYDASVTRAQVAGKSIVEYCDEPLKKQIASVWETAVAALDTATDTRRST